MDGSDGNEKKKTSQQRRRNVVWLSTICIPCGSLPPHSPAYQTVSLLGSGNSSLRLPVCSLPCPCLIPANHGCHASIHGGQNVLKVIKDPHRSLLVKGRRERKKAEGRQKRKRIEDPEAAYGVIGWGNSQARIPLSFSTIYPVPALSPSTIAFCTQPLNLFLLYFVCHFFCPFLRGIHPPPPYPCSPIYLFMAFGLELFLFR
jgi:hypothetical protein